jgi:hypothetical protein
MSFSRCCAKRIAGALTISALSLLAAQATEQDLAVDDPAAGLAAWRSVESVLTHPRCLNCHTMTDYPRQGDERRPHGLKITRGPDGHGEGPKCQACHTDANQPSTGIPGAKDWHMAPLAFAWESEPGKPASGAAICKTLKHVDDDEAEPDFERLIEYAQLASFVQWGWEPGKRLAGAQRTTPLLTHTEFVEALKRWISAGAPCPGDEPTADDAAAMDPAERAEAARPPVDLAPSDPAPLQAAPVDPVAPDAEPQEAVPSQPNAVPADPPSLEDRPDAAAGEQAPSAVPPDDASPSATEPPATNLPPPDAAPAAR